MFSLRLNNLFNSEIVCFKNAVAFCSVGLAFGSMLRKEDSLGSTEDGKRTVNGGVDESRAVYFIVDEAINRDSDYDATVD